MYVGRMHKTFLQGIAGVVILLYAGASNVQAQCPKRCQLGGLDNGNLCTFASDCDSGVCQAFSQCVHLEWRPQSQTASPGDTVQIGLYAVSSSGFNQVIAPAMESILFWDAVDLSLISETIDGCRTCDIDSTNQGELCTDDSTCTGGLCTKPTDPCFICPDNTYNWFLTGFLADCPRPNFPDDPLDSLNFPCNGTPDNDGDAKFSAWSQITCGLGAPIPALATPSGLLISTLQFEVFSTGGLTQVAIPEQAGSFSHTRILGTADGGINANILGFIGAPASIEVIPNCLPPTVEAAGCRYLDVTPSTELVDPIALLVTGDSGDPDVLCVSQYVQANGFLGATPVYLTPTQWGTVHVTGASIRPLKTYSVQADCGATPGAILSEPALGTPWKWADANNDGAADISDVLKVVDAFLGLFYRQTQPCTLDSQCTDIDLNAPFFKCDTNVGFCIAATLESVDFLNPDIGRFGCTTDGKVFIDDVLNSVDAFLGFGLQCAPPCP